MRECSRKRPTMERTRMFSESPFFFQAEDGIRDADVTGVQTCAPSDLDIFRATKTDDPKKFENPKNLGTPLNSDANDYHLTEVDKSTGFFTSNRRGSVGTKNLPDKIGRASCRERVKIWVDKEQSEEKKK